MIRSQQDRDDGPEVGSSTTSTNAILCPWGTNRHVDASRDYLKRSLASPPLNGAFHCAPCLP